ncbi:MAG: hypothetical protein WA705_13640 [Candidatus Ozemobacteraceae bacterium]
MTQNHFHAHDQINTINPKYHVIVPKYQSREFDDDWRNWLRSMNEKLPAKTILFFGRNTRYLVEELGLFNDRVYYIEAGRSLLVDNAPVDLCRNIMEVPTVLTQCLAIAVYMGFKEIFLLGFDLDQNIRCVDRDNVRFYGNSPITANNAEINAEETSSSNGMDWFTMWMIWQQCLLLRKEAEKRGISIFNATRGGLLTVFPRRIYEEIIP